MKETGIIMSGDHPVKILDGTKTMTRRVIKPQPNPCRHKEVFGDSDPQGDKPPDWCGQNIDWIGYKHEGRDSWFCHVCGNGLKHIDEFSAHGIICPFGQVGDRLWVRETFIYRAGDYSSRLYRIVYMADQRELERKMSSGFAWDKASNRCYTRLDGSLNTTPSIFMPRWASRITLEITEVRVERLQEINEDGATAEGINEESQLFNAYEPHFDLHRRDAFKRLWDSLNTKHSWEFNPWVWVLTFRKVTGGIK